MERASWLEYFSFITIAVSSRSTCLRRKVGAVAVRDKRILATGYNGAPRGVEHCLDTGCLRNELKIESGQRHEICRAIHAEQNVIIQAAMHGVSLDESDIFCTHQPCIICSKMLINAGVKRIYCLEEYPDQMSSTMLKQADVKLIKLELEV